MTAKIQKTLAIIAVVVMSLLLAVSTAVPAFAAEAVDTATDSNPQIVYAEPDLGEDNISDSYITLPDAPEKEGYVFIGWRVNEDEDIHYAGNKVPVKSGEKVILTPIYENSFRHACTVGGYYCLICFFGLVILRAFGDNSRKKEIILNILIVISLIASGALPIISILASMNS